ncbi:hypothetical protein MMF93_18320 [Streptomyces tubbatahanensis]|uniref:Integral membrane protein n=1 Tax=Streptomyces tubbatahanensis TaxID=2923272 RepID=A0ABY3XUU5_9ACTN|nr:hypothetical protein [Streptomyces tubbatahanensis]UNS98190.1 hypothetical protein MMF93_18320 [Streptomyces tubbatahanensis]
MSGTELPGAQGQAQLGAAGSLSSAQRKKAGIAALFAALALVSGIGLLKTDYFDVKSVVEEAQPGVFTLDRCEHGGGTKQGPSTFCYGDFRSSDGELELTDVPLKESHDAEGTEAGEAFPARAMRPDVGPAEVFRTDDQGESNLAMRGVGALGLALLGVMLGGFAGRTMMVPGPARSRLGAWLGFGTVVSLLLWLIGRGTGGGFWA